MKKKRVLLVEDDKNFGMILMDYLRLNQYEVVLKQDGEEGLSVLKREAFDLCIFDVMMPKKDGFTLATEFRRLNQDTPFVFLTAKAIKEDVLTGYKIGAEDYIIKPFDAEVLLMKMGAILKRNQSADKPELVNIGRCLLNVPQRLLITPVNEVKLSPKECSLLELLVEDINQITPRSKALKQIWKEDNYFTARSMDVYITKLRKYLAPDSSIEINKLHGSGYCLKVNT